MSQKRSFKTKVTFTLFILLLSACALFEPDTPPKTPTNEVETVATATPPESTPQPTPPVDQAENEAPLTSDPTLTPATSTSDTISTTSSSQTSTAAHIIERGKLLAGVKYDFKPFGFVDDDNQVVGFDVDIVREFARRWLGDENAIELVQVTSSDRIPRLAAAEVDLVAASMTHKQEREELIDFSQTYFLDGQSLLVNINSGLEGLTGLDGGTVAALQGSTSLDNIQLEAAKQNLKIEILPYQETSQALEALQNGLVDAFTSDSVALLQLAQDNPDLAVVGEPFTQEPYALGLPQGDSAFRELVNLTLQEMKKDGSYNRIYQKWFPNAAPYPLEILPGQTSYTTLTHLPSQFNLASTSGVEEILSRGKLLAGVKHDFKPFGFVDDNHQVVGFDVDLVREFARRWLGDENAIELVQVTSSDRIPRLVAGEVDLVAASMTHKRDRAETIDFSQTYFLDGQSLLVQRDSGIDGVAGLDGKTVAALQGSTSLDNIRIEAEIQGIAIEVLPYQETSQALQALQAGLVDAFTTDSVALSQLAQDDPNLLLVGGLFTAEPYGLGIPQNDFRLRELVNFTLQEMKKDGTYDTLYTKWFGNLPPYQLQILPGQADYLPAPTQDLDSLSTAPTHSKIQLIRDRGHLIAGVKYDFKPFGFVDDSAQVTGFDVDLIQAIAAEWGVTVEFVQVTSSDRIPKLLAGEVDIVAASMTHKKSRDEQIDFSQTYFFDGQSLLVAQDSGITGVADLDGKNVAALQGSTSLSNIQLEAQKQGVIIEILPYQETAQAIEALNAGLVDAFTTDSVALSQFADDNPGLLVVGGLFTDEPYGLGLPPGDSYFNDLVNFTLQQLKENGQYNQIYDKWFGLDHSAAPYELELLPGKWPYTFATSPITLQKPTPTKAEEILARGKLIAGVKYDFKPFGFVDDNNQVVGFDVDIVREFAQRWLGDPNAVELIQVTSSDRIPRLAAGEVDLVAASMTHKKERDETIDFSQTYFLDGQSLLVRADSNISGLADLDGKIVAALQGSTSIDNIQAAIERQALVGPQIVIEILPFQTFDQALIALDAGQVDAFTSDSVALHQAARTNPDLIVAGGLFTAEPYGLGLPQFDDQFRDLVNFTLQEMKKDGTYNAIYCTWFETAAPYNLESWPGEADLAQYEGQINLERSGPEPDNNCLPAQPEITNRPIPRDNAEPYDVAPGDTLSQIAATFYDDISKWELIYEDNKHIIGPDPALIEVGMILRIRKLP